MSQFKGPTICAVKRNGVTAIAGDGQVTMGQSIVMKGNAKKVKRIYDDKVVVGFAGSVSDAFTFSEKFEEMLQKGLRMIGQGMHGFVCNEHINFDNLD